ncbi:ead/Ea22-like family protein [Enterobacteriaceae bacterium 155047]|nr:ead/Ea22-like family protein [Huaxiibacter chinensis]
MSNIDKRALLDSAESTIGILENIAGFEPSDIDGDTVELRFETEDGFDTGCDVSIVDQCQKSADVIRVLLDELEAKDKQIVDLEATEAHSNAGWKEAHEQEARAEAAEKRIAELEMFINQSCYVFDGRDVDISDAYIDAATSDLMPKIINSDEDESCRYCSDGSYSGLPGGACEHCMGTGLDNPAAGIKLQIEGE